MLWLLMGTNNPAPRSLLFNGTDGYSSTADASSFDFTQTMSIVFYGKSATGNAGRSDQQYPVTKWDQTASTIDFSFGIFCNNSTDVPQIIVTNNGTSNAANIKDYRGSLDWFDGDFHTCGITFDGSLSDTGGAANDRLKLWVDGAQDTSPTKVTNANITTIFQSAAAVRMGTLFSEGSPLSYFAGNIAKILISNVALSALEMAALHNSGDPMAVNWAQDFGDFTHAANNVLCYQINTNTNPTSAGGIVDLSGNNNDATGFNLSLSTTIS